MRNSNLFSAVLSLFLLLPASITGAQSITSRKGLSTAEYNLPQGKIKVYLPDDVRPGDIISGTIAAEPAGKNVKQIEKNRDELSRCSLGIDAEVFRVNKENSTFRFIVRPEGIQQSPLQLLNAGGNKIAELIIQDKQQQQLLSGCMIPSHALTGSPFSVRGAFDGNSANTKCSIEGKPAIIIAESPRLCVISFPPAAAGQHNLDVQEKNQLLCSQIVSGVGLTVSAGKLDLNKGEQTFIDVDISGLQELPDTAFLTLDNLTTGIVNMQPSNNVQIPLSPDSTASGIFKRRFDIRSIRAGSFTVEVNLDLPDEPPIYDIPGTGTGDKTDTVPCRQLEETLKAKEEALSKLKDELLDIDGQIRKAKLDLLDCKDALKAALADYYAAKKEFDRQAERKHNYEINKQALPPSVQKDYDDAKKGLDDALKKWSDQNKKCRELEGRIAELEARKKELPGLIKSLEEEIGKLKSELEKCKQKEAEDKKKKEEEERRKTEALPAGETTRPGEGEKGKEGSPCNPDGAVLVENKRVYEPCEVESTDVTPCNMGKLENAAAEAIKEFLKKFKKLSKPIELAEKLADCASTAKAICINIHVIRKWQDIEYKYECINGKWVLMNTRVVRRGEDDYGWFKVNDKTLDCCWVFDGSPAMQQELANKIQERLDLCK